MTVRRVGLRICGCARTALIIGVALGLFGVGCAPSNDNPAPQAKAERRESSFTREGDDRVIRSASAELRPPQNPEPVAPGTASNAVNAVLDAPTVTAYARPDRSSEVVASFDFDPSYPQYFLATSSYADYEAAPDAEWLEVFLPIRPNGSTGWIQVEDVVLYQNRFKVEIDVSDHSLTLLENNEPVFTTAIGVGTGDTPTPIGSFYTTVLYDVPDPDGPYGPYAFALSGFSEVLTSFNGGDGLIGIHGTNDPASLGRDISHGCIRIPNELITQMAESIPLGTPVEIVP